MNDVLHACLNGTQWTNKLVLFIYNLLSKQMEQLEEKKLSISVFDRPFSKQNPSVSRGSRLCDCDLNFPTAATLFYRRPWAVIDLLAVVCCDVGADDEAGIMKWAQTQGWTVAAESASKAVMQHQFLLHCGLWALPHPKPVWRHTKQGTPCWKCRICFAQASQGFLLSYNTTHLLFACAAATTHYLLCTIAPAPQGIALCSSSDLSGGFGLPLPDLSCSMHKTSSFHPFTEPLY